MLVPAILHKEDLEKKFLNTWYVPEYFYYYDDNPYIPEYENNPNSKREFVSINENNEVIGYFSYQIDRSINGAYNFGLISFDMGNIKFIRDIEQGVEDIFLKFGLTRMEWMCYADNPAARGYQKFVNRHGGIKAGTLRQVAKTMDNKIHDVYIFEILREDYLKAKAKDTVLYLVEGDSANEATNIDTEKYGFIHGRVANNSKNL